MSAADTVLRHYVAGRNVSHSCVLPRDGGRDDYRSYRWECPVCRAPWMVNGRGSGSGDSRFEHGEIIAFLMRYPDGTTAQFHIEPEPATLCAFCDEEITKGDDGWEGDGGLFCLQLSADTPSHRRHVPA